MIGRTANAMKNLSEGVRS